VDAKADVLRQQGALHPNPDAVHDETFRQDEFCDPRDLVQVRYEMLRRHQVDGSTVAEVAGAFGLSRQAYHMTEAAFAESGVAGLLPRRRGPRRAHKCTGETLDFVEQWRADSSAEKDDSQAVQKRFRVSIHPRSIERALSRRKNNDDAPCPMKNLDHLIDWKQEYENLRREALQASSRRGHGWPCFCRAA
jgi:transposase